jgi:hypothetical protein
MKSFIVALLMMFSTAAWAMTPVESLADAIARAEGFGPKQNKPTRFHNPGDFRASSRHAYAGQVGLDRQGYVIFKSDKYGWKALTDMLDKIARGDSPQYSVNDSLAKLARKYATSPLWLRNVAKNLGVKPNTPLWTILDCPPAVTVKADPHALDFLLQGAN